VAAVDVGAGSAGKVGSAPPGAGCGGGDWWGARVAEATTAARTAAVSPKANTSSRQGWRGLARWRGVASAWCIVPVRLVLPRAWGAPATRALPAAYDVAPQNGLNGASCPSMRAGDGGTASGGREWGARERSPPVIRGDWSMERPLPLADDLSRRSPFRAPNEAATQYVTWRPTVASDLRKRRSTRR
jgi:hypothetical protein